MRSGRALFCGRDRRRREGLSVVNPIGDVLRELSTETGSQLSLVGTNTPHALACLRYDPAVPAAPPYVGPVALARAQTIAEGASETLRGNGILGTAAGHSLDSPGDPAVTVYADHATASVPATIGGLRTQVIVTDAGAVMRGTAPTMPPPRAGTAPVECRAGRGDRRGADCCAGPDGRSGDLWRGRDPEPR